MKIDGKFVETFEKISGQLSSMYEEIGALSKKNPDGPLKEFKIKFVNSIISQCNTILEDKGRPFAEFEQFDIDTLPTASDVVMILGQYINCMEELRSDNVKLDAGQWRWRMEGDKSGPRTFIPIKLQK